MPEWTEYIVLALAVWRAARLAAIEDGPLGVLRRLRWLVGVRYGDNGAYGLNSLAEGLACVHCNSLWFGVLAILAFNVYPKGTMIVAAALAFSAVAVLLQRGEFYAEPQSPHD